MKYVFLFLMLGLSLKSIGQNRYHVDETRYFEPEEYQEHIYDSYNDIYEWVTCPVAYRALKADHEGVNGIVFDTLNNGQLIEESHWKNGTLNGVKKTWYENGQLENERTYQHGAYHGLSRRWYENGQLKIEGNFKDGKEEGLYKAWHENGQLQSEGIFKDGKQDGLWKIWHENGQLKGEWNYKDGNLISKICWDEKGNKIECD